MSCSHTPCWGACQHKAGPCPSGCCWYGTAGDGGGRHFPDGVVNAALDRYGPLVVREAVLAGKAVADLEGDTV